MTKPTIWHDPRMPGLLRGLGLLLLWTIWLIGGAIIVGYTVGLGAGKLWIIVWGSVQTAVSVRLVLRSRR